MTIADVGEIGGETRLHTHLVVREDQLALFGFASADELAVFETLIAVNGVGPRLACAILSHLRPDLLALAISNGDVDRLATVPGIGKKTAARLIVDLRGKLPEGSAGLVPAATGVNDEAVAALRALGYTAAEANTALARIESQTATTVEERVFLALRDLGGGR
jgi:Holliday junction DNA helicase RuvA